MKLIAVLSMTAALVIAVADQSDAATPSSTPCKPNRENICVKSSQVPRSFRTKLPRRLRNYLTPFRNFPLRGELKGAPAEYAPGESEPQILIPAGTESKPFCRIVAGEHKCIMLSAFKPCPDLYTFQDEEGSFWTCSVDCSNSRSPDGRPDSNGNCDCDVEYDTCRPGF